MAKLERQLQAGISHIANVIHEGILNGSASASYEDGSDFRIGDVMCYVRVYERYSMMGGNRVSLNVTLMGDNKETFLSAITSGGSQAVLFKFNTFGEEAFLDCLEKIIQHYL